MPTESRNKEVDIERANELVADSTTLFTIGQYRDAAEGWQEAAKLFFKHGKEQRAVTALRAR